MAISFVSAGTPGTGSSASMGVPTGYAAGDFFLLVVYSGLSVSTPSGWTSVVSGSSYYIFKRTATASESAVTFSGIGAQSRGVILDYRGTNGTDALGSFNSATSATATTTSLTTTLTNDYVISMFEGPNSLTSMSTPTGTTLRFSGVGGGSYFSLIIVDELQASAGATTARSSTLNTSGSWTTYALSISETATATTDGNMFLLF